MGLFSNRNTLSIDFAQDEINIIEGKFTKKGIVVNKYFSIELPDDVYKNGEISDMDQLVYLLRKSLDENKITQADVNCIINSTNVILREITMPKVDEDQIKSILKYQLEDYIPINPEEYIVNFMILGTTFEDGTDKLNILLIGVPKVLVESHLNLIKNMGLRPAVLDYQGNAINKLIYFGEVINNSYPTESPIACIEWGYENTNLTITQQGVIKVSRVIELGAKYLSQQIMRNNDNFSEKEILEKLFSIKDLDEDLSSISEDYRFLEITKEGLDECLSRVEMVFRYYRTRGLGNEISLIVIHGLLAEMEGIDNHISNFFGIPCVKLNSVNKVKFNGDLSKYANAIGGLVRLSEV